MLLTTSLYEEGKRQPVCNVSDAGHLLMTWAPLQSCHSVKKAQFIKEEQSDGRIAQRQRKTQRNRERYVV